MVFYLQKGARKSVTPYFSLYKTKFISLPFQIMHGVQIWCKTQQLINFSKFNLLSSNELQIQSKK